MPPDVLHTIDPTHPASPFASRVVSLFCITFAFILHSTNLKWGLRVQNALGATKLFVLVSIALSGMAVLLGVPGFHLDKVRMYNELATPNMMLMMSIRGVRNPRI